jgi:hypothetical protein
MTINRRQKTFTLSDGRSFTIHEANWQMATDRQEFEESARQEKAKLNGSGDPDKLFFMERIYPILASCSIGENVPTSDDAITLPEDDLDNWFFAVRDLNPGWFPEIPDPIEDSFQFRDGTELQIKSILRPSVQIRLQKLETQTDKGQETGKAITEVFRILYYPKLAACSIGAIPSIMEALDYPESELNNWYNAVNRVNPTLFMSLEAIAEENKKAAESTEKKTRKRRKRS